MEIDLRDNRYAPSPARVAILTELVRPRLVPNAAGLCLIEIEGLSPESDLCRALEREVFDDTFGDATPHTPQMMAAEYGPYEETSTFFAVFNAESAALVGMVRVIDGFPNKTISDLAAGERLSPDAVQLRYGFSSDNLRDLGTVAVTPSYRGSVGENIVAASLYRTVYVTSLRDAIAHWTGVIDTPVLKKWLSLGIPFRPLDDLGELDYLGSHAQACVLHVEEIRPNMEAAASVAPPSFAEAIRSMLNGSELLPELESTAEIDLTHTAERDVPTQVAATDRVDPGSLES